MARGWRWPLWLAGAPAVLLLVLSLALLAVANTASGQRWIEAAVARATAGAVTVDGLAGRLPDAFGIARVAVTDRGGTWLVVERLRLDWSPLRLLAGDFHVVQLAAERVLLQRLPAPEPASDDAETALPVALRIQSLRIGRLELAPQVAGREARVLTVQGSLRLSSLEEAQIDAAVSEAEGGGEYRLRGTMDAASVQAGLTVREAAGGVIASLAGLPDLGTLTLQASLAGPRAAVRTTAQMKAGELAATLAGTLDLRSMAADLKMSATAQAMRPSPDLSWRHIALDASLRGPFATIAANGSLTIDALRAGSVEAETVLLEWRGDPGRVSLEGRLQGLRVPGADPDVQAAEPVRLSAHARFGAVQSVNFSVRHPLLSAEGSLTGPDVGGRVDLRADDLTPLAAAAGLQLRGRSSVGVDLRSRDDGIGVRADGRLSLTGGDGPLPALIGENGALAFSAVISDRAVAISDLQLKGRALELGAEGSAGPEALDLRWRLGLRDLGAVRPDVAGHLVAVGAARGPVDDFELEMETKGDVAFSTLPAGALWLKLQGRGLPRAPTGTVAAGGMLAGAVLELGLRLSGAAEGAWRLDIDKARWKSARAAGTALLPKGAAFPLGSVELRMGDLSDLSPLLGQPLAGSLTISLAMSDSGGGPQARLLAEGHGVSAGAALSSAQASLDLRVDDPAGRPQVEGSARLEGTVAGRAGRGRLDVAGPLDSLDLQGSGALQAGAAGDAELQLGGRLDARHASATLTALEADWKGETLRLLQPVRLDFAGGLAVDRLRLGLRDGELEVHGRLAPALAMEASLRRFPADLVAVIQPELELEGQADADLRLTGVFPAVSGSAHVAAEGLRWNSGPGRGVPAANLQVEAALNREQAHIDARLAAGPALALTLNGQVPLRPSQVFDLHAGGHLDLKLLEPLLAVHGRRARGRLSLDAALTGPLPQPRLSGQGRLDQGEWQDYALGMHVSNLSALLQAEGEQIRLVRLQGRAGAGTLTAQGGVFVTRPGIPLDLSVTARRATLLSSERLEVNLDADLTLRGRAAEKLAAGGRLRINRAEIRIPERMPASIAVLNVREAGVAPPPPPAPGPDIALDLKLEAPEAVFVRGRGLDAELGGTVRLRGSLEDLQPDGGFMMRRGQFSLAGQTLTFSKGIVGFDGARLTDPSLNFIAEAGSGSGNVTARLQVTGTAQKPKINLSSVPDLPQDEVLSQLLFGRGAASLSPFEMVQIAQALASLTGILPAGSDPLESVRGGLGLDRLSIGGSKGPTLEGGRYVAPGVYVGAKQGASTNSTQGMVQIDVTRGLKLEASVGTGSTSGSTSGASSVGVIYQYEY